MKHNSTTSLYVATKDQIKSLKAVFELLDDTEVCIFEKLTKHILESKHGMSGKQMLKKQRK